MRRPNNSDLRNDLSWNSPRLLEIEREWGRARAPSNVDSGDRYGWGIEQLARIVKSRLSKEEIRRVAGSCATMPAERDERSAFADGLLQAIVIVSVETGDRQALTALLATRYPEQLFIDYDTESYIVAQGKELQDPILVLFEAYSQSKDPKVQVKIAAAVRHAFAASGVVGKADSEFLKNAETWYKRRKDQLERNLEYNHNVITEDYDHVPLFRMKQPR